MPISRLARKKLISTRQLSTTMDTNHVKSLLYKDYGDPINVLQMTTQTLDQPASNEVNIY